MMETAWPLYFDGYSNLNNKSFQNFEKQLQKPGRFENDLHIQVIHFIWMNLLQKYLNYSKKPQLLVSFTIL